VDEAPFTPDWHEVVSAVVDVVQRRPDVDAKRVALIGVSFGGMLVMRAAAYEHRLAAIVSDPGGVDVYDAFPQTLRDVASRGDRATVNAAWNDLIVPGADPMQQFALRKRLEIFSSTALREARQGRIPSDWYGLSHRIQEFTLGDLAQKVTTPTLVVNYELEAFYPGQAQLLFDRLPRKKHLVTFTVVEGAQYHDAPIGSQWHGEVVMDWLDEQVS
jgi:pimeloyl-ACP methyl ester carboxylesterase